MEEHILKVKRLVWTPKVQQLCTTPYTQHPKGCPMFGRKDGCPPQQALVPNVFSMRRGLYLVYETFNLDAHARRMKTRHPQWTDRQCRNVLYWQAGARHVLRQRLERLLACGIDDDYVDRYTLCPEGMGVNVFQTAHAAGLHLEPTNNLHTVHLVALVGHSKNKYPQNPKFSLF